ncbi:MAG: hypothetical protein D6785_07935, partial [Planctomycetota bacterium]
MSKLCNSLQIFNLFIIFLLISGCASQQIAPGQLAMRAMEVRPIDAPYDVGYRAATHALFTLGLTITHSEKESGILNATRTDKNTGAKIGMILLFGVAGAFIDTDEKVDVTMFLSPSGEKQTKMRIGIAKDGEIITDQTIIDRIWVLTQREALLELGET